MAAGDGEGDEGAEERDQRRQRERDRARGPCRVHVSVPFGWGRVTATGRQSRLAAASEADGLDRLGGEGEAVDRLRVGVEDGQAGRDRQRVAARAGRRTTAAAAASASRLAGPPGQPDGQAGERDGRGDEAEAGAGALVEVAGHEGAVDAGADRAGEDDDVALELGERHLTITSPSMSWRWRVQT